MKIYSIKYSILIVLALVVSACGGGSTSTLETETMPATDLSVMVDGIIAENLDHADHTTWDLNNFEVNDDINGNAEAETKINAMVDSMIATAETKP